MKLRTHILAYCRTAAMVAAGILAASCTGSPDGARSDGDERDSSSTTGQTDPTPWVTLVTGDRVLVTLPDGLPVTAVEPAAGRERMSFSTTMRGRDVFVMPADAAELVAAGRLDAQLFNVSAQVRFGYDDAHRASVPLVVTYGQGAPRGARAAGLSAAGAVVTRELATIRGVAAEVDKGLAAGVWRAMAARLPTATSRSAASADEVEKVWLDGLRYPTLDHSVPQIGAPAAWDAGYTGEGVVVAVLDSGIDDTHPDFAGQIVEARNFTTEDGTTDRTGHGTHVASTIAGTGAASSERYRGVAPGAHLLIGKVCDAASCPISSILAGIEWAAVEKAAPIVSMSLGGPDTPEIDPIEEAINRLSDERGTLFVVAAGNEGLPESIASPGSAEAALTVGAVDSADELAVFSSQGPRLGDGGIKPDLTAPGVGIAAALATGTNPGEIVDEVYVRLSGTSMATPHVAGAAALLLQQHPDWRGDQLKAALMGSAAPSPFFSLFEQGAGRVDVAAAIAETVVANPASLNLGLAPWPHGDDEPIARTVTYTNTGSTPVVLHITLESQGPDGQPAPAALLTASPAEITVPAGGAAAVVVAADTRADALDGEYSGRLVAASADGLTRTTPFVLQREAESYNLVLTHLDRAGARATTYDTFLYRLDGTEAPEVLTAYSPDGEAHMRLPRGRYFLNAVISTQQGDTAHRSILVQPSLSLSADTAVTLDSRTARPIHLTLPWRAAELQVLGVGFVLRLPTLSLGSSRTFTSLDDVTVAQVGPDGPPAELLGNITAQLTDRGPAGDFVNSPHAYFLSWTRPGRFFTGFDKRVRESDVTVVQAEYRATGTDQSGWKTAYPLSAPGFQDTQLFSLPFRRTEYYGAEASGWSQQFTVPGQQGLGVIGHYQVGRRDQEVWNGAVFGPAFPDGPSGARIGDDMTGLIALLSDGDGHLGDNNTVGVTRLFRGTEKVGERPFPGRIAFSVDPTAATYRLETEVTRTSPAVALSTRVTAAWTFRSEHTTTQTALPLLAVRFTPPLDDQNRARAGVPLLFPVSVVRMPEAPPSRITSLAVEASFDDGATWRRVSLLCAGPVQMALLFHPAPAGFVSLRATATDAAGNRVEETILRAFAVR